MNLHRCKLTLREGFMLFTYSEPVKLCCRYLYVSCAACYHISHRQCQRPNRDQLVARIGEMPSRLPQLLHVKSRVNFPVPIYGRSGLEKVVMQ